MYTSGQTLETPKSCHIVPLCATCKTPFWSGERFRISFRRHDFRSGPRVAASRRAAWHASPEYASTIPPMYTIPRPVITAPASCPGFRSGIIRLFQRTDDRRLITITKTNRPKTEASSHISIDGIKTCFDELTVGQKPSVRRNSIASNGLTLMTQMLAQNSLLCALRPGSDSTHISAVAPGPPARLHAAAKYTSVRMLERSRKCPHCVLI